MCGKEARWPGKCRSADFLWGDICIHTAEAQLARIKMWRTARPGDSARPIWLDAQIHDRWVAATSQLPFLVANALAAVAPLEALHWWAQVSAAQPASRLHPGRSCRIS